jgi:hypothetical protein
MALTNLRHAIIAGARDTFIEVHNNRQLFSSYFPQINTLVVNSLMNRSITAFFHVFQARFGGLFLLLDNILVMGFHDTCFELVHALQRQIIRFDQLNEFLIHFGHSLSLLC